MLKREIELFNFYRKTFKNWLFLFFDYNLFNLLWRINKSKLAFTYARKKIKFVLKNNDELIVTWRALPVTIFNDKEYTHYEDFIPKKGMRILDAGAHIGIYTYMAASKGAEVISIEPLPTHIEILRKNANFKNVRIIPYALSYKNGTAVFYVAKNFLAHSLVKKHDKKIKVKLITLKEILKKGKIDLLKMDIEGEELNILKYSGKEIRQIPKMVIETHNNFSDVAKYLEKYNFKFKIHDSGRLLYCWNKNIL